MTRIVLTFLALTALAACDYGSGYNASQNTGFSASSGAGDRSGGY